MRSKIITALVATVLPLSAVAQDDMYFVPTKEQVQAEKEARQKQKEADAIARQKRQEEERKAYIQEYNNTWKGIQVVIGKQEDKQYAEEASKPTYYSGINKSVDDYNRRTKSTSSAAQCDTTVYSKDSIASDIIDFTPGNGYPKEVARVDTVTKYIIIDDEDYRYSRWMSRWDDYCWRWGWGYTGWYAGWYGPYSPWYDPFYDPWFYDPWYRPGWYYGPGWYGPHWAYDPWYRPGWGWGGWYGPGHIGGGTVIIHDRGRSNWARTGGAPSGTGNHAGWRYNGGKVYANNSHGSSSGNISVARRNGDAVGANTGYTTRGNLSFNGSRTGSSNYNNSARMNSGNYNRSSYNNSSSSGRSGGGSFSGGGHSGGGHSGGFSGGGRSGGGHFGGGRR